MGKKIIAVEPWGSSRTSVDVKNAADLITKWNTRSIIRHALLESKSNRS